MKLSFIPADLHLDTDLDGHFKITLQGTEIYRAWSSTRAIQKFTETKRELEEKFAHMPIGERNRQRAIGDYLKHRPKPVNGRRTKAKI